MEFKTTQLQIAPKFFFFQDYRIKVKDIKVKFQLTLETVEKWRKTVTELNQSVANMGEAFLEMKPQFENLSNAYITMKEYINEGVMVPPNRITSGIYS